MKDPPGILIVDDDAVTLRATSRILKSAGYQVTEAANGAECLRLAREQSPDLILLDVVLPDESGVQICQRLKADSQLANVFVVLLSGIQTDSDSRAQGLEAGADGYIARPIANRELVARVQALLRIKAAEDALRASEERFRTVADFTSDWEYWIGVDSKPVYVSPSCERITGYRTEEFMQDPSLLGAIIHPDDRALMDSHQRQVLTRDNSANFDFRIVTRGGEERWINHVCQPVYGTGGRWLGQRASNRDITDRKHAEEALRNAAREWKTTFDAVTDAVWLLDKEQRIVLANQATQRVFNLTPENIIGKHCWQVVHGTPEPIPECPIIRNV